MNEKLRAEIVSRFTQWAWSDATDEEVARDVHVRTEVVRELRAGWRRDLALAEVIEKARGLAKLVGWPGTETELILWCLDAETVRAEGRRGQHPSEITREAIEHLREARRLAFMEAPGDG